MNPANTVSQIFRVNCRNPWNYIQPLISSFSKVNTRKIRTLQWNILSVHQSWFNNRLLKGWVFFVVVEDSTYWKGIIKKSSKTHCVCLAKTCFRWNQKEDTWWSCWGFYCLIIYVLFRNNPCHPDNSDFNTHVWEVYYSCRLTEIGSVCNSEAFFTLSFQRKSENSK